MLYYAMLFYTILYIVDNTDYTIFLYNTVHCMRQKVKVRVHITEQMFSHVGFSHKVLI